MTAAKQKPPKKRATNVPSHAPLAASVPTPQASTEELSPLAKRILDAARIVKIHRSQIKPVDYNPRQIDSAAFKKLCESVKRFGLVDPPIVNEQTGNLVGGHQRLKALDKVLGTVDYELRVSLINVDLATEKALNIALNNPSLQGQYDIDLLQSLVLDIRDAGEDIHITGFSKTDMFQMFDDEFLTGVFAEQVEAEAPILDQLEAMRAASKQMDGAASSETTAAADSGVDAAAHRETPPDAADPNSPASPPPSASAPAPPAKDSAEYRQQLHNRREAYKGTQADADDADVILNIVFDQSRHLQAFIRHFKLPGESRYIEGHVFAECLGLDLSVVDAAPAASPTASSPSPPDA